LAFVKNIVRKLESQVRLETSNDNVMYIVEIPIELWFYLFLTKALIIILKKKELL